jgi:hypothetical protein
LGQQHVFSRHSAHQKPQVVRGKRYLWRRCANSTVLDWGAP